MIDRSLIEKLEEMTMLEKGGEQVAEETSNTVVALHDNVNLRDLEKYLPYKRRFQAHMRTTEVESFKFYTEDMAKQVQQEENTRPVPVFVDADHMSAMAVFDIGSVEMPLHSENRATVTLEQTAEYREFLRRNNDTANQRTFAEWLEDWRDFITVYDSAGEALTFAAVIAAVRNYEVTAKQDAGSEEKNFGTRKTAMSEVNAKNADKLPAFIGFSCRPYKELTERELTMRVSIKNGENPHFTMRAIQLETIQENIANEFCDLLRESLAGHDDENKDLFTVLIGSI